MNIYSNILKLSILPIADIVMETKVGFFYREIIKMQSFSKNEVINWQTKQLMQLLNHAYNNTAYYHKLFNQYSLTLNDFRSLEDLEKLPVLTKEIIRKNFNDLIPNNVNNFPYIKSSTGGSTGDPLIFLNDKKSWSFAVANTIFNWEKAGYKYGDKYIALGSSSLFVNKKTSFKHRIYYKLKNKIGLNGINMSDEVCAEYLAQIKKEKIRFVYGYASSIYLLAKYLIKTKQTYNLTACFPTSEILTDFYRGTINDAFKCKILDGYGANDGGILAFEHDQGYYEVGYNSILNYDLKQNKDHILFPVVLTDLFNYSMPLINYHLGDEILVDKHKNQYYKYNGQVINKVLGRLSDIIELENGSALTGPGFTILFKDLPVEYYHITKNGYNFIECNIKKLENFTVEHEKIVLSTLKRQVGNDVNIKIKYIDIVALTSSGKRKYFN